MESMETVDAVDLTRLTDKVYHPRLRDLLDEAVYYPMCRGNHD